MSKLSLNCYKCNNIFDIKNSEFNRQTKKGRNFFFCSTFCSSDFRKKSILNIDKICLYCNKNFVSSTHRHAKKCCSQICAKRYAQTFINIENTSNSVKKAWERGDYNNLCVRRTEPKIHNFTCTICSLKFQRISKKSFYKPLKTCSKECLFKLISKNNTKNSNCGGETNYKKLKYKDIWMDSSWEVEIAKWMDESHIKWERSKKLHQFLWTDQNGCRRRYYPDFYLPQYNLYLDTKNKFLMIKDKFKIEQVLLEHKIVILVGSLQYIKDEITNRFKTNE